VDAELIRRLETLAGLSCAPDEREALSRDLRGIVAFADRLAAFVEEDAPAGGPDDPHRADTVGVRADRPRPSLPRADALSGAAATDGDHVLTPPLRAGGGR